MIGERRFRAAHVVGLDRVPAPILEEPLGPEETLETRLIENLHQQDIDPLDEAEA